MMTDHTQADATTKSCFGDRAGPAPSSPFATARPTRFESKLPSQKNNRNIYAPRKTDGKSRNLQINHRWFTDHRPTRPVVREKESERKSERQSEREEKT